VAKKKHGGRRPGAGAPKGNFNALKHGRRSQQFAEIGALIAANPKVRDMLLDMGRKHQLKQAKADQVAAALFAQMVLRAQQISGNRLFDFTPADDRRSIKIDPAAFAEILDGIDPRILRKTKEIAAAAVPAPGQSSRKMQNRQTVNQRTGSNAPAQSNAKREIPLD
jgi:hypothetical protein